MKRKNGAKAKRGSAKKAPSTLLIDAVRVDRKALSVVGFDTRADDVAYWRSRPVAERFEAIELLRQIAYGYDPSTERLQRVLEVTRFEKSPVPADRRVRRRASRTSATNR